MKQQHAMTVQHHAGLGTILALCLIFNAGAGLAVTRYVSTNGAHISPYTNWANASTNILRVITVSSDGDVIIVSNGVHYCYSVSVGVSVEIRSLNGPEVTAIDNSRFWGLLLSNTGTVDGFTIQNGSNVNSSSMLIYSNSTVKNCIFSDNYANRGGALQIANDSLVSNCLFVGNTGITRGGAVYVYSGVSNGIYNCTFYDNWCTNGSGGAIYVNSGAGVECRNLLIYSNRSVTTTGGGILATTDTMLRNCTIVYNQSSSHGGGVYNTAGAYNSIIFSNDATGSAYDNWSSSATFTNCCIEWQTSPAIQGENNITNDPAFVAPLDGNFQLSTGSPCINSGVNQPWMTDAVDLGGHPRLDRFGKLVDRGCYEYIESCSMFTLR